MKKCIALTLLCVSMLTSCNFATFKNTKLIEDTPVGYSGKTDFELQTLEVFNDFFIKQNITPSMTQSDFFENDYRQIMNEVEEPEYHFVILKPGKTNSLKDKFDYRVSFDSKTGKFFAYSVVENVPNAGDYDFLYKLLCLKYGKPQINNEAENATWFLDNNLICFLCIDDESVYILYHFDEDN